MPKRLSSWWGVLLLLRLLWVVLGRCLGRRRSFWVPCLGLGRGGSRCGGLVVGGWELGGRLIRSGVELVVGVVVVVGWWWWWIGDGSSRAEAATKLQLTRLQVIPAAGEAMHGPVGRGCSAVEFLGDRIMWGFSSNFQQPPTQLRQSRSVYRERDQLNSFYFCVRYFNNLHCPPELPLLPPSTPSLTVFCDLIAVG